MTKKVISRGFHGRRQQNDLGARLPPGQYLENGFPVLSAGPTPRTPTNSWSFSIWERGRERKRWTRDEFHALPHEQVTADIHCVTKWSKLDTHWEGVSVDRILDGIDSNARYVMAASDGGYTTNLPLEDVLHGKAWIVWQFEGMPLAPEHGGSARLLVPHLYLWKSAKWIRSLRLLEQDEPGFWESLGYNNHGDPWKEERYWGD
jgi:DMSO/TMAO reductase YedYZ molybdopterin-dependent catalytic subunit